MHLTTVISPWVLVMAGLTVAATADDSYKGPKHPKGHKDHGASFAHCGDECHDAFSGLLEVAATHTLDPVALAARAMPASVPDDQIKLAARSANDDCKCTLKTHSNSEYCLPKSTNCIKGETAEFFACIQDQALCDEYAAEYTDTTTSITLTLDPEPTADAIPGTLQVRAMATPNAWDDLGPVTFRTERPEMAVHEIDPRSVSTTTTMGRETTTYATTTTEEIDVMSVIVITDTTTTSNPRPITTTTTSTSSAPTGPPMTTISNIKPGSNTVQMPPQSSAPVVIIVAPSESYSVVRTVETLWSSVMQPVNIATATVTRDVSLLIPAQAATSTGKANGASTTRSGAGVTVMAGVGVLAACFMMF